MSKAGEKVLRGLREAVAHANASRESAMLYLLMGESGEYEQRWEVILGLFERRDEAERAAIDFAKVAAGEWAANQRFMAEVKRRAVENGFPEAPMFGVPNPDAGAWRANHAEQQRIIDEMGGEPPWRYFPERYAIAEVPTGQFVNIRPDYDNERPVTDPSKVPSDG